MGLFTGAKGTVPVQPLSYLMLDEKDFSCLVRGGVLHVGNLRIALKDIGFDQMNKALDSAIDGIEHYKDHIKQQ
jgi:hypothetical protein